MCTAVFCACLVLEPLTGFRGAVGRCVAGPSVVLLWERVLGCLKPAPDWVLGAVGCCVAGPSVGLLWERVLLHQDVHPLDERHAPSERIRAGAAGDHPLGGGEDDLQAVGGPLRGGGQVPQPLPLPGLRRPQKVCGGPEADRDCRGKLCRTRPCSCAWAITPTMAGIAVLHLAYAMSTWRTHVCGIVCGPCLTVLPRHYYAVCRSTV